MADLHYAMQVSVVPGLCSVRSVLYQLSLLTQAFLPVLTASILASLCILTGLYSLCSDKPFYSVRPLCSDKPWPFYSDMP